MAKKYLDKAGLEYLWTKIKALIAPTETKLNSIETRSVSFNYSLTALGYTNTNLKTLIDADLPTGYKCLGIAGMTTNDIYVYAAGSYYANSNYSLQLRNTHDGPRNNRTAVIYYLCIKE